MRLTRVAADLPGAFNLPYLDAEGAEVDPAEHSAALLGGFRAGYDAIAAGRAELTNLLEGGRDDPIRVLLRSTNFYARLLDETTHPKLLHDADARDQAFDLLETDADGEPTLLRLAPAERAELWAGDIPLFASSPGSTTVWDSSGIRHPDVLKEPTLDVVLAKLRGMTTVDQRDQEWLISAALVTSGAEVRHTSVETVDDVLPSQAPDAAQLLAAACGIADQIVARAFTKD